MSELVLVDTSAWTRFLRSKPDRVDVADEVERLLVGDLVCYTEPIFIELVAGAGGEDGLAGLKRLFAPIRLKSVNPQVWDEAVRMAFALGMKGFRKTPMADVLIAACACIHGLTLFHHHPRHFKPIADVSELKEYCLPS